MSESARHVNSYTGSMKSNSGKWQNNTKGQGLSSTGNYNSFYSCKQNGVPVTEPPAN
jgi:hypothetical protein